MSKKLPPKPDRRSFLIRAVPLIAAPVLLRFSPGRVSAHSLSQALTRGFPSPKMMSGTQRTWRFCKKCYEIYFDGYADKGRCIAGGGHVAAGYDFALPYEVTETPTAQKNWRFCNKCHAMFFDGYADKSHCAAGGGHVAAGYNFVLPHDVAETPAAQKNWRFCSKCHAMFFDGYQEKGHCAGNPRPRPDSIQLGQRGGTGLPQYNGHVAAGFGFVLPHVAEGQAALPPSIHLRSDITTPDWAPVGGWVDIQANDQGHFTVSGHMHNSGAVNIQYALAAILMTPSGAGYGFAREHQLDGTVTIFGRNRDDDWNVDETHPEVAGNWADVAQSTLHWRLVAQDTLSKGLQGLVEDTIKEIAKEYGKKAVIALIEVL